MAHESTPLADPLRWTGCAPSRRVARRLSFSGAATELFVTQSAVSRQIKALETALGAPLFSRGTRHVELTDAGEVLRQAVLPALDRVDRAVRQIRSTQGRRQVNLSTFASFATLWLMPRLTEFQQQHADIDIRISAGDQMADLGRPRPGPGAALRLCRRGACRRGGRAPVWRAC